MIVSLEGPDKAGKSTLLEALRGRIDAVFVRGMPMPLELLPVMPWVELRQVALWEALYDSRKLYICDRHVITSSWVYDRLYDRPCFVDAGPWLGHIIVAYLDVPQEELRRRFAAEPDDHFDPARYKRVVELYSEMLKLFPHVRFDGAKPAEQLAEEVLTWCRAL